MPAKDHDIMSIVLEEIRALRTETAKELAQIHVDINSRIKQQTKRTNEIEARTRRLEVWRGYIVGIGTAIAFGVSYLVNRLTGK